MTRRFEFEVDTTRAVASWEAEVADNLARRHTETETDPRSESHDNGARSPR